MIEILYKEALENSPISEHLPFLKFLAAQPHIKDILEVGTAVGDSTLAFLMSNPAELISIDKGESVLEQKLSMKERGPWKYILQNPYHPDFAFHADLLFSNTYYVDGFHKRIRKWILLYGVNFNNPEWTEVYSNKDLVLLERIL